MDVKHSNYMKNKAGMGIFWICGAITILIMAVVIGYILVNGLGVINWQFLTESPKNMMRSGGIYPTIIGTIVVTGLAILVATPLAVGAAIYMAEYAGENIITRLVRFGADSLSGIPSIIFGLFGYLFFVYYLHMGFSVMAGGLTLAIMSLPVILRVSEESIRVVPGAFRTGSLALGASKWQTIRKVVLPTALPGIMTGIILGTGRAVGETAAVMLTAGSVAKVPDSLFEPVRTMTLHVYILSTENLSIRNAFGTAAVLVIMVLAITIISNYLTSRYIAKLGGRI
jgi:phosphate transport system permease protein